MNFWKYKPHKNQNNVPSQSYARCMNLLWEAISLMNACWVSQPMFFKVLNAVMSVMQCLKKMFNGEIKIHLKKRLKRLCYYKWRAWYKLLPSSGLKKYMHIFIIHQTSFWGAQNIRHQILCSNLKKRNSKLKVYISLKKNKFACFTNS